MRMPILILIAVCCMTIDGMAQTIVRLVPSSASVDGNGTITLAVSVVSGVNVTAASVTVDFPSDLVTYKGVVRGDFLPGAVTFVAPPSARNPNIITVDQAILGGTTVSGTGNLFSLTFVPRKAGAVTFSIASSSLITPPEIPITCTIQNASMQILASVNCRVMLQGPFNPVSRLMDNLLNVNNDLPLVQPYRSAPWLYAGAETVDYNVFSINRAIIDWILVELRTGTASVLTVASRAGFLLEDGRIVDIDGVSLLRFNVPAGNYYIVVKHRNHVAVMNGTQTPVDITSPVIDFTAGQSTAYGKEAMQLLAVGMYGMAAGDANSDGRLTGSDYNVFYTCFQNIEHGYLTTDLDMSGAVTGSDYNVFLMNYGKIISTAVPH